MKKCFVVTLVIQVAAAGCHVRMPGLKHATGSDTRIAVGAAPNSVEIADFNGDGTLDLVVANSGSNNVTILLGDGKGAFVEAKRSPFPAGHSPNDICIGDFNGDGKLDLAIANHEVKYLTVLSGDGQGGFSPAPGSPVTVLTRPHTHGVATGDFNRDGKLDLVTDSWGENKVTVVFGDGHGGFGGPSLQFAVGKRPYQRVRVADVSLDGNADIITTNLEGDNVTILLGDGKGSFNQAAGSPFPCGKTPFGVAIGDLNGDGKPDLAVANWAGQRDQKKGEGVTIVLGDGRGGFQAMAGSPLPTGDGPGRIAIGDVDGDGVPDVVVANYTSGSVTVLHGRNGTFMRTATIPVGNHPQGIALGDLNGDGKADIVVTNSDDNSISIVAVNRSLRQGK
jgi:FG-GAP-like repeat